MTTALEGVEGSASRPGRSLPPGKTRYPLYRRLGGPQGRSGQVRKISPPPVFDPRTFQPVASRYTYYATRSTPRNCKYPLLHLEQVMKCKSKPFTKSDISAIFYTKSPLKLFLRFFVHNTNDNQQSTSIQIYAFISNPNRWNRK
jgi:hypothetical protein